MAKVKKDTKEPDESLILISEDKFEAFCQDLETPKPPNPGLKKLFGKK